jgi:hypothetical protein
VWIVRGTMPGWLGLWWVHAIVALLAAAILLVPRWLARVRYRRNMASVAPPVPA